MKKQKNEIARGFEIPKGYAAIGLNFELPTGADQGLPERIILLPGDREIVGRDGRRWRNSNPGGIVTFLLAQKRDLVMDFEHATEIKAPEGDSAPAAAWLNDFSLDADGAVSAAVSYWTPTGEKAVKNREYRYISPVILYQKDTGEIKGITSIALTNRPNLYMPALNHQQEEATMKNLLKLLGLAEDATEDAAINAVSKLQNDLQTATNREVTPDLAKFVPRGDYDQMQTRAVNAEQKLADDAREKLETEINSEIDTALKAGKISPASKDFYRAMCKSEDGLQQFREFLKTAPVIAEPSGLDKKPLGEGQDKALNAEEQQIIDNMGISREDYLAAE